MSCLKVKPDNQGERVKLLRRQHFTKLIIIFFANNCHVNFNLEGSRTFY